MVAVAGLAFKPKLHEYEVIVPEDASVNVNVVDKPPFSGLPLKSAVGAAYTVQPVLVFVLEPP